MQATPLLHIAIVTLYAYVLFCPSIYMIITLTNHHYMHTCKIQSMTMQQRIYYKPGPALGQGERGGRSRPSMPKGPSSRVLDVVGLWAAANQPVEANALLKKSKNARWCSLGILHARTSSSPDFWIQWPSWIANSSCCAKWMINFA